MSSEQKPHAQHTVPLMLPSLYGRSKGSPVRNSPGRGKGPKYSAISLALEKSGEMDNEEEDIYEEM